jgi:hypothetical protein
MAFCWRVGPRRKKKINLKNAAGKIQKGDEILRINKLASNNQSQSPNA